MSHKGCFYQNIQVKSFGVINVVFYQNIQVKGCHIKVVFIKIYKLIALMSNKGCFYQNIRVNSFDAAWRLFLSKYTS